MHLIQQYLMNSQQAIDNDSSALEHQEVGVNGPDRLKVYGIQGAQYEACNSRDYANVIPSEIGDTIIEIQAY